MKKTIILLTLIISIGLAGATKATKPLPPFRFTVKPITNPTKAGLIKMVGTATGFSTFNDVKIGIEVLDNLEYIGEEVFKFDIKEGEKKEFYFEVVIPDNDTSGIRFMAVDKSVAGIFGPAYFVVKSDTIEVWPTNPRRSYNPDYLPKEQEIDVSRLIPGEFPHLDSIYGVPEPKPPIEPGFSTVKLTEEELQLAIKRTKERYVLTDKPYEVISIGNEEWRRNKGEQYFWKMVPITDTDAHTKYLGDSLQALPDDHEFDVCINLRDDKNKEAFIKIYGSLPEFEENGYYHCRIKKGDIPKLQKAGILRIGFPQNLKCNHYHDSQTPADSKKNFNRLNKSNSYFQYHL